MRRFLCTFCTLLLLCFTSTGTYGAPSAPDETAAVAANFTEYLFDYTAEVPVKYDGAQLWRVDFGDDQTKEVVINLQNDFG